MKCADIPHSLFRLFCTVNEWHSLGFVLNDDLCISGDWGWIHTLLRGSECIHWQWSLLWPDDATSMEDIETDIKQKNKSNVVL